MRFWCVLLGGVLCLATPARAMEQVDLAQVLREAVRARPMTRAARAEARAAEAAAAEARGAYFPHLSLGEILSWTDEPAGSLFIDLNQESLEVSQDADVYNFPSSRRDFETRLSLRQPLYDPDISYGHRRADYGARSARAEADWTRQEAAFAAYRAYLDLRRARGALEWSRSAREEAAATVNLAEERFQAGTGLKADLLRAEVALAEARRRVRTRANDLTLAQRYLALVMGRSAGSVDIATSLEPEALRLESAEPTMQRDDLNALRHRVRAAEMATAQSRSRYLPRAGLEASYSLHDGGAPFGTDAGSWKVGASLTWDIFDGGSRRHAVAGAEERERAVRQRWLEATRKARFRVEEATLRAREARLNLETARQAVAAGEAGRRQLEQRYRAGLADVTALLAAQEALDRARFDLTAAKTELLLALGRIRYERGDFIASLLPGEEVQP